MSELSDALQGTFMTCENRYRQGGPEYEVRIRCPTLKSAQRVHNALVSEVRAHPVDSSTRTAYAVNWTEYGRGVSRPDGYTLHATPAIAQAYIRTVTAGRDSGPPPGLYSAPGEIFLTEVTAEQYAEILREETIWGHICDNLREP